MFSSPLKDGVVVLLILILFFGAKRLPELSRALGQSVKEFKVGIAEGAKDDEKPAIPPANNGVTTPAQQEATGEHAGTGSQSTSQ